MRLRSSSQAANRRSYVATILGQAPLFRRPASLPWLGRLERAADRRSGVSRRGLRRSSTGSQLWLLAQPFRAARPPQRAVPPHVAGLGERRGSRGGEVQIRDAAGSLDEAGLAGSRVRIFMSALEVVRDRDRVWGTLRMDCLGRRDYLLFPRRRRRRCTSRRPSDRRR